MKVGDLVKWIDREERGDDTDEFYGSDDALGVIVETSRFGSLEIDSEGATVEVYTYEAEVYFADGCSESHEFLDLVLINESR